MAALPTPCWKPNTFAPANPAAAFCTSLHPVNDKADFSVQAWYNKSRIYAKTDRFRLERQFLPFLVFSYRLAAFVLAVRHACCETGCCSSPPPNVTQKTRTAFRYRACFFFIYSIALRSSSGHRTADLTAALRKSLFEQLLELAEEALALLVILVVRVLLKLSQQFSLPL